MNELIKVISTQSGILRTDRGHFRIAKGFDRHGDAAEFLQATDKNIRYMIIAKCKDTETGSIISYMI